MYFSLLTVAQVVVFYSTHKTSVMVPKNNFRNGGLEIDTCWLLMSAQKDTKLV